MALSLELLRLTQLIIRNLCDVIPIIKVIILPYHEYCLRFDSSGSRATGPGSVPPAALPLSD